MSYARMGEDSDVYILRMLASDGYHCLGCKLAEKIEVFYPFLKEPVFVNGNIAVKTPKDMLWHLSDHYYAGHKVPSYAIQRLKLEDKHLRKIDRGKPRLHIKR
jgi:hypothetical protein